MGPKYQGGAEKVSTTLNLELNHKKFLNTVNASDYIRWLLDNDEVYQKYIKEQKEEKL